MSEKLMITWYSTLTHLKAPFGLKAFIEILLKHRKCEVTIYISQSHTIDKLD